ncbi:MAG TPA: hypothetical protein VMG11_04730 [Steroidobacteraceae bacterium]|nr:hypothetical protein [Steroidobacteraceae bacterium]
MQETKETLVYRVCAGAGNTWNVFADSRRESIASFHDKSEAVRHALRLARGRRVREGVTYPGAPRASDARTPAP